MAILIHPLAIASVVLAGCYSPDLPDCRVHCESAADCAPGQRCSDHACSGAETMCPRDGASDAMTGFDATLDALATPDAAPDGPPTGILEIEIQDHGQVAIVGGSQSCDDAAPGHRCSFAVVLGTALTLQATPAQAREFDTWHDACAGMIPSCTLVPATAMTHAVAKFRKDD